MNYIILILLIIVAIVICVSFFIFQRKEEQSVEKIFNEYPDGKEFPLEEYKKLLQSNMDLNDIKEEDINNTLRQIAISWRYKLKIKYKNLKLQKNINLNNKVIGTKLITNDNNVIIFIDDFIFKRKDLEFDFQRLQDHETNKSFLILKQFMDYYNQLDDFKIDSKVKDLYVYARGCSVGLAYIIYFKSQNIGKKEFLCEGYPSLIIDENNVIDSMQTGRNRSVFINILNDPNLDLTNVIENEKRLSYIKSYKQLLKKNRHDYINHGILNYYGL